MTEDKNSNSLEAMEDFERMFERERQYEREVLYAGLTNLNTGFDSLVFEHFCHARKVD